MAILSRLKRAKSPKTEVVIKTPKTDCEVVTFSRLDYWSMLDLFDRIPVHDLVRLNGLASWWSGYVTKVCRTKRDITVQCGDQSIRYITSDKTQGGTQDQFNLLKVTRIGSHTSDRLGRLLPSITSLEIIIEESHEITDITYLISKWSHQLVNLKIKCNSYYSLLHAKSEKRNMQLKQLFLSLNTITSLRRLTIDCKWWKCSQMQDPIDLPILSQLEYLYLYTRDNDFDTLRHSLVRYAGPNDDLKQIELPSLIWSRRRNDLLGEHQLLPKFTMLKLRDSPNRYQWALFANLTTVNLGFIRSRSKFMRLITGMQCLKLLRNLDVQLNITRRFDDDLDRAQIDLPQLPSVTNLKLETIVVFLPINSYSSFKSLKLGTIFPNLQSVHLGYDFDCSWWSSYCVVKWTTKICNKISYRMFKLRVRGEFPGVKCAFTKPHLFS